MLRCFKPLPIDELRIAKLLEAIDEAERQVKRLTGVDYAQLTRALDTAARIAKANQPQTDMLNGGNDGN